MAVTPGPFLISTRPPGKIQRRLAHVVRAVMLLALLVTLCFRHTELARLDAFVPVANSVVGLNDLLTALLLYAQFSLTRARALLVLASGFLFKALILVPHAVTFPGVIGTHGLLGAPSLQATAWLFPLQQMGFGLCALLYTVLRDQTQTAPSDEDTVVAPIVAAAAATIALALSLTWILFAGRAHLPRLIAPDGVHLSDDYRRIVAALLAIASISGIVVLRRRPKTMIDLWLHVAVWSWLCEAVLTMAVTARFSLVFYVNRGMGIISSSFVLFVLLSESAMLHRRLVAAIAARDREREGHRTAMDVMVESLAHELRQPLGAILMNGQAGAVMVAASPRSLDDVRATFADISRSARRANEIIDSVRSVFAHSSHDLVTLDVNELIRESVDIVRPELEAYHIDLRLDLSPDLSTIRGHGGQLTQVLMNGFRNSIESLATISTRRRELRIRTVSLDAGDVAIRIEDSGRGLDPAALDRVFAPFYTTKKHGMGLGLAICKSIVEGHEGSLSLLHGVPYGAVLQIELPAYAALIEPRAVPFGAVARSSASSIATISAQVSAGEM